MTNSPSIRYASLIATAPQRSRKRIARYVDNAYSQGDPPDVHHASSWRALVVILVDFELDRYHTDSSSRKYVNVQTRN